MSVDARTEIMTRIRAALRASGATGSTPAAAAEFGQADFIAAVPLGELSARFARELAAVGGEAIVLTEGGDAALSRAVADHIARFGYQAVAVQGAPLSTIAASSIPPANLIDLAGSPVERLGEADCAIVAAESLIADTGSAVVRLTTYEERLLPYLPPACIIVGRASQLTAGLDDAALRAGDEERGERVIITGPSRTADIEKTVVLGAHGPGSLTVFIATD